MSDQGRDVVVTGAGVCCRLGDEFDAIEAMLKAGETRPMNFWPAAAEAGTRCTLIAFYEGEVDDAALGLAKKHSRFMGRASRLALKATQAAIAQSGIDPQRCGLAVGSGTGDVETHHAIQSRIDAGKTRRISPAVIPKIMASTVSANLVNSLGCMGPSFSATAACAGGAYNILLGASLIQSGHADAIIAGGVEARDIHFHAGFDSMRAFNAVDNERPERASRPYAADRKGFIFGEGAGIVVLESREAAEARGAEVLGVIRGAGMSSDGDGDMVAPSLDGPKRAFLQALEKAGIRPEDVDYVNTHGTSTPVGDVNEVNAFREALGGRQVRYSSTKGYTGHTISAAGAIEAIFTLAMLRGGWVAPSAHASPLDPALEDYPPVLEPSQAELRYAVSNSFGFGGTNVALVLSR